MNNKLSVACLLLGSKCKPCAAYLKRILSGLGKTADAPSPKKSAAVVRFDDWRPFSRNRARRPADYCNAGRAQMPDRLALRMIDCGSIDRNADWRSQPNRPARIEIFE